MTSETIGIACGNLSKELSLFILHADVLSYQNCFFML
jgi:hypothetical protein